MFFTVYYKNGMVEDFALGLKSAKNLVNRLIESDAVNSIVSVNETIYIN